MTKISKIEAAGLGQEALALSLSHSAPEAYRLLREAHPGVDVGDLRSFQRYVSKARSERAARVKARIDEKVIEDLPDDLGQLDELKKFYREIYQDRGQRTCDRIQAADKARAVIDTKLKYSGAGAPVPAGSAVAVYLPENGRQVH
jgi:streptomycin 6-kinase